MWKLEFFVSWFLPQNQFARVIHTRDMEHWPAVIWYCWGGVWSLTEGLPKNLATNYVADLCVFEQPNATAPNDVHFPLFSLANGNFQRKITPKGLCI